MKKTIIAVSILLTLLMSITAITLTQKDSKSIPKEYSYTTAICDETNFCQDHIIICDDKEIISISPITGAFIQFSSDWKDPRSPKTIKEFCIN